MHPAKKQLLLLNGDTYWSYMQGRIVPELWFHLNEQGGVAALNYGSYGAAFNGVYTALTLAQAGRLGPAEAVLYDGVTSLITVPAGAHAAFSAWTFGILINPSNAGEGGLGAFYTYGSSAAYRFRCNTSLTNILATRGAPTSAVCNPTASGLVAGTWYWLFVTFDNLGDRKLYVYRGSAGTVTDISAGQIAAVGTLTDYTALTLIIGNRADATQTLAGSVDEFFKKSRVLTTAELLNIVRLSGA